MKIGLLSFHNAANYGAALQAFALQKALDDEGFEVEYINYQNNHRKKSYSMSNQTFTALYKGDFKNAIRYILGSPFMLIRKIKFKLFYKKRLRSTKEIYTSSDKARTLNGAYTKFIVGSDQVWNWENNGGDDSFLLSFVEDNSKKISYSSSFGIAEIPKRQEDIYRKYLTQIKYLSVREQYGVELVKNLTNRTAELVLDPVFLLSQEQWLEVADSKHITESFIFSYTNRSNQLENFLSSTNYDLKDTFLYKLSRSITAKDFLHKKIRVKYSISPSKFLSIIRDSQLIVSASFHCVAMAIIMKKPFIAILTGDKGKDERLTNILSLLSLEKRIYNHNMTKDQVDGPIDYVAVHRKLHEMRSSSFEFLLNAINH